MFPFLGTDLAQLKVNGLPQSCCVMELSPPELLLQSWEQEEVTGGEVRGISRVLELFPVKHVEVLLDKVTPVRSCIVHMEQKS